MCRLGQFFFLFIHRSFLGEFCRCPLLLSAIFFVFVRMRRMKAQKELVWKWREKSGDKNETNANTKWASVFLVLMEMVKWLCECVGNLRMHWSKVFIFLSFVPFDSVLCVDLILKSDDSNEMTRRISFYLLVRLCEFFSIL